MPAAVLATVGVVITAAVAAGGAALVFDLPAKHRAADRRGRPVHRRGGSVQRTAAGRRCRTAFDLLQMESGLNHPVAVMLTIGMVEVWRGHPSAGDGVAFGLAHLLGGLAIGLAVGVVAQRGLRRLHLPSPSSYPVLALAVAGLTYGIATVVGSSGFLAVYITGSVLGRRRPHVVESLPTFHEGTRGRRRGRAVLDAGLVGVPIAPV